MDGWMNGWMADGINVLNLHHPSLHWLGCDAMESIRELIVCSNLSQHEAQTYTCTHTNMGHSSVITVNSSGGTRNKCVKHWKILVIEKNLNEFHNFTHAHRSTYTHAHMQNWRACFACHLTGLTTSRGGSLRLRICLDEIAVNTQANAITAHKAGGNCLVLLNFLLHIVSGACIRLKVPTL